MPKQPNYIQYAKDVVSGKIPACEYVKQACNRFFEDLKRKDIEFRQEEADRVISVISMFRHTKGAKWVGKHFIPEPWQAFIIANIFGFYRENGKRRYTKSYLEMPKKNGKSPLAAAIAAFMFIDSKGNPEVYSIATELPQATISWDYAATMLETLDAENNGELGISVKRGQTNRRILINNGRNGVFSPLSFGDNERHDGKSPVCGIVDEYHAHKNNRGYAILADGVGAQIDPHIMAITTAGFDRQSACYKMREHCTKILSGQIIDDATFTLIYTTDKGDDWTSPITWAKVNPNYGISVSYESFADDIPKALEDGASEVSFRTKKLNEWMDSYTTWIPDSTWMKCKTDFVPESGAVCWAGLDLARTGDFSALTFNFHHEGKPRVITKYFMPEDILKEWAGEIGANLRQWAREGWITATPGNATDYAYIEKEILKAANEWKLVSVGYDPANATDLATRLFNAHEINMRPFSQAIMQISLPTKRMAELITAGTFEHDGNPVTRWMMGNVQIYADANDNIKIVKSVKGQYNKSKKVDGPVSIVMSVGEAIDENNQPIEENLTSWAL